MTLDFVIPVYNEANRIHEVLTALEKGILPTGIELKRVIFVNDGSTDNTVNRIQESTGKIKKNLSVNIEIISYKPNKGKGYAVRKGLESSLSDYALVFDADMSTPLSETSKFIYFMKKEIDFLVGTRKNGKATVIKYQPLYRQLLGIGFTALANLILQTKITDHTCGFKAFSSKAKTQLTSISLVNRWAYDSELLFLASKYDLTVREIPVLWTNDERTKVNLAKDILRSLKDLISIKLYDLIGKYSTPTAFNPSSAVAK